MRTRIVTCVVAMAALAASVHASGASTSALSRNGVVAFVSDRGPARGGEIYAARFGGRLKDLSRSAHEDSDPVVSPDGQRIAFFSRRTGSWALYVERVNGTGLRRLAECSSEYRQLCDAIVWTRDGNSIAYA